MPVVDASVWVANYHEDDRAHRQSATWLWSALASGERLIAPTLVLAELAAGVGRLTGSVESARIAVEHLVSRFGVELVELDGTRARATAELAALTRLRGADAVYLALAVERADVLISLDRQQRERGGALIEVREP